MSGVLPIVYAIDGEDLTHKIREHVSKLASIISQFQK